MKQVIEELKLNISNKKAVIACSCGVDSMALLHLALDALPKENIIVAHVNHGKRKESIDEQKYIEDFCKEHSITLEVLILPTKYDGNFQEWARTKRYLFFHEVAKKYGATHILLAHHANDNLETIIMRLMKSSSLKGYGGIEKYSLYNEVNIYRPLIYIPKEEIIKFVKNNNITYFEDSSNNSDDYTRNRIRHHIIPLMLEENPSLYSSIENYSKTIFSANKLLEKVKVEFIENKIITNNNSIEFRIDDLLMLDEDLRIHILFRILRKYNLSRVCLDNIYKQIISKKNNIVSSINNELVLIKEYGKVIFYEGDIKPAIINLNINEDGEYNLSNNIKIKVDKNICYFITPKQTIWYNIKSLPIIIRNRQDGDKIKLSVGTKSVSDYLTNKKVPYLQRKDTLVLCDEFNNVLNILGYITK